MTWWVKTFRAGLAVFLGLVLCGCLPNRPAATEEEKEPQFLIGRSRVNAMDYPGAIDAFEQALTMNPRSAAAHLELGWLQAEKELDPAAAIYHYQKFLELRPTANNTETIRQQIFRLKQELAKSALPIPPSTEMQRQLEQLTEEKRQLQDEVDRLRQALLQAGPTNNRSTTFARPPNAGIITPLPNANSGGSRPSRTVAVPASPRTHRVQSGDTLTSIAGKYGIKLAVLQAANPNLNPRKMQVGQSVVIPAH